LNERSQFPQTPWSWHISDVIYDSILSYGYTVAGVQSALSGYFVLKYQLNGKWGLIHIPGRNTVLADDFLESIGRPSVLGRMRITEAKYDKIVEDHFVDDGLFNVLQDGKWGLLEIISTHPDDLLKKDNQVVKIWSDQLYKGNWDTIPLLVYKSYKEPIPFIRQVRKDGKYGIVKLNQQKNEIEYLIDCDCDYKIKNVSNQLLICEKTEQGKVVIFDIAKNKKFEMSIPNKPLFDYKVISIDTIPDNKQETHKTFLMLGFGSFYLDKRYYNKGSELYFIDLGTQKLKAIYKDTTAIYNFFDGVHGVLIMKKINTQKGVVCEFIDLETSNTVFSLPPEKKEYTYNITNRYNQYYSCDYLNISARYYKLKDKDGSTKYGNVGCYDYRTKKYKKGKCPACY
jgi:hypothetical protein